MMTIIRLLTVTLIMLPLIVCAEEEGEFYKPMSKDGEVLLLENVQVGRWTPVSYTIAECEIWIAEWKRRAEECMFHAKEWEDILIKVREEAKKVRLKESDQEDT